MLGDGQGLRQTPSLVDTITGLHVLPHQTLALVGGDVEIEGGTLKTAGGRIELGSIAAPGLVGLTSTEKGWALGYEGSHNFGSIKLSQQAAVDASGEGGGDIHVQGRWVTLSNGSQIEASTLGSKAGGMLTVTASELVELIGTSADGQFTTSLGAQVYPGASGSGGNLNIKTGQLIIRDGAQMGTGTFGSGSGGNTDVQARDLVELIGKSADNVYRSGIFTYGQPGTSGAGGNSIIQTGRLIIRDGAQIFSGSFGKGATGSILISAHDLVELIGQGESASFANAPDLILSSAIATSAQPGSTGPGGNITLQTQQLIVRNGAVVSTATFGGGQAGTLSVSADSVNLGGTSSSGTPSSLSARSGGEGNAGDLNIKARQLTIQDGAQVTVRSDSTGKAGSLLTSVSSFFLDNKGSITASSASGQGGNLFLNAQKLQLRHNSAISATASGGNGNGGNIKIDTRTLVALENSLISANAFKGQGGNIQVNTQGIFLSSDSEITASSQFGINGTVRISTLGFDARNALTPLAAKIVNTEQVIANSCLARRNATQGSFVSTGTGGLPVTPYDNPDTENSLTAPSQENGQPSSTMQGRTTNQDFSQQTTLSELENQAYHPWQPGKPIAEGNTIVKTSDGHILLVAAQDHAPVQSVPTLVCH